MKRKILPILSLLATMTLVACGGPKSNASAGNSSKKTSTSKSSVSVSRHTHTYNENVWEHDEENHWHPATCEHTTMHGSEAPHTFVKDTTKSKDPTCKVDGVLVEKCSVCGYEKAPVTLKASYQYHTIGARTWTKKAATKDNLSAKTEAKELTCTTCGIKDVAINALDYVAFNDADTSKDFNKIADGTRLKFGANNSYADYTFDSESEFDAMLYLYGCVDYWKDNNNNNHNRGFFNSGNAVNIAVTLNDENITVTNTHSYLEMGIPDPADPNPLPNNTSGFGFAEVAPVHIKKGSNTLRYTRKGSYNMDITEIHFMEHHHEFTYGDPVTKENETTYKVGTCECGKKDIAWSVTKYTAKELGSGDSANYDVEPAKLGKNGTILTYEFTLEKAISGKLYVRGWVDHYEDSNNNKNKGFYPGGSDGHSGTDANIEVYVGETKVDITNKKSYAEMGVKAGENEAAAALCEIGAVSLAAGKNTITIKRLGSYTLSMYDFHVIG